MEGQSVASYDHFFNRPLEVLQKLVFQKLFQILLKYFTYDLFRAKVRWLSKLSKMRN